MNKKVKIILVSLCIIIILLAILAIQKNKPKEENTNLKIVSSFYPIHIITMNLVEGAQNVKEVSLTQNNIGLGLENFMDKILQVNKDVKIIDSSANITNTLQNNENVNPHIWTSIENYTKQVETISQKLCEYNPENSLIYKSNCEKYVQALNELKAKYDEQLAKLNSKS